MLLVAGLCLAGFAGSADATNLLTNGSFEDDFTRWESSGQTYVHCDEPDVDPQDGRCALKMYQNWEDKPDPSSVWQDVPVTVGTSYVISGYLRNGYGDGKDQLEKDNSAFLQIQWLDADGNPLLDLPVKVPDGIDPGTPPGEWIFNSLEVLVPELDPPVAIARVAAIHQYLENGDDAGSSWFDNLTFEPVPEPGTIAMLCSGLVWLLLYGMRRRANLGSELHQSLVPTRRGILGILFGGLGVKVDAKSTNSP